MTDYRLLHARAEQELRELRHDLSRLSDERLRLARKLERISGVLYELCGSGALNETQLTLLESALSYDGSEAQLYAPTFDDLPDEEP